jgi:hypothetical protein
MFIAQGYLVIRAGELKVARGLGGTIIILRGNTNTDRGEIARFALFRLKSC